MEYFCDNPECVAHVMVEDGRTSLRLSMSILLNYKELHRHDYVTKYGKNMSFCTNCAKAIQMVIAEEQL